jgi:hypothetical protein
LVARTLSSPDSGGRHSNADHEDGRSELSGHLSHFPGTTEMVAMTVKTTIEGESRRTKSLNWKPNGKLEYSPTYNSRA